MQKILHIIVSVAMLTGCSKELPDEPATPEQGEQVEVTFGASLTPESAEMSATQQRAESPASRAQIPFTEPQHGLILILDKSGKTIGDPIGLEIAKGGAMTTKPEKVILTAGTQYTFRSVVASADDPLIKSTSVPIYSLKNKQGEYPDLLYATATQTVTVGAQVQFAYNHLYGKVKFVLSKGLHVTDDQLAAATLEVSGYCPEGAFDIITGKITTEPFENPVTVEKGAIYYAIPQTFTALASPIAKVTIDGKTYIGKITKGDITAGKLTTITIQVNVEEDLSKKTITIHGVAFDFVLVEAGTFQMGAASKPEDEQDRNASQHWVKLTKDYYIGKYELTQEQYEAVMGAGSNPSLFNGSPNNEPAAGETQTKRPVENISWNMISEFMPNGTTYKSGTFLAAINATNQGTFRLPTEAEWEYAARGGHKATAYMKWAGTNDVDALGNYAWVRYNSERRTHEVGKKAANALGLYDMSGNVKEWVYDRDSDKYTFAEDNSYSKPEVDPTGSATGQQRSLRGGDWSSDGSFCRSARRYIGLPTQIDNHNGFRLVLVP